MNPNNASQSGARSATMSTQQVAATRSQLHERQSHGQTDAPNGRTGPLPAIELEIGELAVQGFPGVDRDLLGAAIQSELARLLTGPDAAELVGKLGGNVDLAGGNFRMPASMHPEDIGREIARALVDGLRR